MSRSVLMTHLAGVRAHLESSEPLVGGVLLGLVVLGMLAIGGRRWAAVLLVPCGVLWLFCNQRVEGPTLWAISYNHGVTAADLLSFLAFAVAGWRLLPPLAAALRG
jgi:hypothetical protein